MSHMSLILRSPLPSDLEPCGRILSDAFSDLHRRHGFPPDFPNHEIGVQFISGPMRNPSYYGVVAELDRKVVGSNFLDERDPIRAVGPISVDPSAQGHGAGRKLMEAVIERGSRAPGIRLVQEAFNTSSLPLYASLGFDPVEPLFLLSGKPRNKVPAGYEIRRLVAADLEESATLCGQVYHRERSGELKDAVAGLSPYVAVRQGRITAYCTTLTMHWAIAHGVAESEEDMRALILGVAGAENRAVQFLMPVRQASFFRWCLSEGLKVMKPLTLIARGEYREPQGCWFPSVMY
jgi:GNAT superfamily N-acetyltransferase